MASLKNDFLKLQTCKIKGDNCSYPAPSRGEIAEMAKQLDLPMNLLSNIFNKIGKGGLKGGAAAEETDDDTDDDTDYDSDDESLFVSESGRSQSSQDNIVNNIMLAVSIFIAAGGVTVSALNRSAIQDYVYNNGILEPLCKGELSRAVRLGFMQIDTSLGGSDCEARLAATEAFIRKVAAYLVMAQSGLTYANWNTGHKLIKDKLFGSMRDQERLTKRNRKKKKKAKTKRHVIKKRSS